MGITGLGPGAAGQVGLGLRTGPGRDLAGTAERWDRPRWREGQQGCERAGWAPWRRRYWESIIYRWKLWVCEPWGQGACALCPVALPEGWGREDRGSKRGVTTSPQSRSGASPGHSAGLPCGTAVRFPPRPSCPHCGIPDQQGPHRALASASAGEWGAPFPGVGTGQVKVLLPSPTQGAVLGVSISDTLSNGPS